MAGKGATLEIAVLGLLHDSPLHGYELRKRLNLLLGWTRLLSYGSLYPALKRMLRAGLVTEVTSTSPGVSRRQRIVYQITPTGAEYFGQQMADGDLLGVGGRGLQHALRVLLPHRPPRCACAILEGRRSRLQERLDRARSSRGSAGSDRWVSELQRHAIESVEREVRWLSELIDAERGTPGTKSTTPSAKPAREPPGAPPRAAAARQPDLKQEGEPHGIDSSRHRGSRQLRQLPRAGRGVLQGRRPGRRRPRPDARHLR